MDKKDDSVIQDDAIKFDEKKMPVSAPSEPQKILRTFKPKIDLGTCTNSYNCIIFCPYGAISKNEKGRPVIDYNLCTGCLICLRECPSAAITEERETK
jgi:2-oxoacid:acceptor oxidoreductase delta subunit (pyruvate/2-ketoisovalerate family)